MRHLRRSRDHAAVTVRGEGARRQCRWDGESGDEPQPSAPQTLDEFLGFHPRLSPYQWRKHYARAAAALQPILARCFRGRTTHELHPMTLNLRARIGLDD